MNMPSLHSCAQRVRYPNDTTSGPFIVPWSLASMLRMLGHLHGRADWRTAETNAGFDPGSSRFACAHDGMFWSTLRIWMRHVSDYSGEVVAEPFGRLSMAHMQLLLAGDDEFGWQVMRTVGWSGRRNEPLDPVLALARTGILWSRSIEEWGP